MKFFRTVRLDDSDLNVFDKCASPGEWAVPGGFAFIDLNQASMQGKALQSFRNGFLGTNSFGWSTLVSIEDISDDDVQLTIDRLAQHFIDAYGAPHLAAALPQAQREVTQVTEMCEAPTHTLLAMERDFTDEGVRERLRVVNVDASDHAKMKLWALVPD